MRIICTQTCILVEAANHAVDDQAGMLDRLVEPGDIAIGLHLSCMPRQVQYRLLFFLRQNGMACELIDEALEGIGA